MRTVHAEFPSKLRMLIDRSDPDYLKRNKILYGGRGGLKSWGAVDAALIRGSQQFERVLCARETMDSIAESVHHLLEQRIYALGLENVYKVLQYTITGPEWPGYGRTEFIFAGLRHNVRNIKSLEGTTLCIVEEAESVSKDSWDTLLPTIRWEDKPTGRKSEIWVIFNPRLPTDDTYQRWILNAPPDTAALKTSWRDNPWFPEVLRVQMEHEKRTNYTSYLHIWEGECVQALEGAIFAEEYRKANDEHRITTVPYDPSQPVDTYWDLGYGDTNAIWFIQRRGARYCAIDYLENKAKPLNWYILEMTRKPYIYGTDWLPHDGVDALLHGKLTQDRSKSPDMVLRALGRRVRIAPKLSIAARIDAGRNAFPLMLFDREKCAMGLQALQNYQWGPAAASGQERTKPLHDVHSHGADAYQCFAVSRKEPVDEGVKKPPARPLATAWG